LGSNFPNFGVADEKKEVDVALNVSYEMLKEEQRRLWRALSIFPQTFDV